ncbi:hypothetical protein L3X38_036726 [Prunus dulcis]|uniref:Uncharacterized protein n=1 Tax=Prunus dulcis TaxID=3755 RepID=A0AAD4YQ08_PRUDU|nr:hypothetical protein L3X38_036726 [Prunus dulcis]
MDNRLHKLASFSTSIDVRFVAQEVLRSLLFGILEYGILNPHCSSPSSLRHRHEGAPVQSGGVHRPKLERDLGEFVLLVEERSRSASHGDSLQWAIAVVEQVRAGGPGVAYCPYRTSPRSVTGFSPYSLVYEFDAISPVEITISTARVSIVKDLEWDTKSCSNWRLLYLEALDKKRAEAERRKALYHKTVAQAYNRTVKHQAFKQGDLVLKVVEHVRRQVSGPSKFALQWEDPFAVKEVYSSGYYHLVSIIEGTLTDPINKKWLKPYCAFVIAFLFVLDMNSFYVLT